MLIISFVSYFLSGLVMLWSLYVHVLLLTRLLKGFGIGLAVTLVSCLCTINSVEDVAVRLVDN